MEPLSCTNATLSSWTVRDAFKHHQGIIIRGALYWDSVRLAHRALKKLMADQQTLATHPYDAQRRVGYTPPGVEHIQRTPGQPDWNRAMLDLSPRFALGDPVIMGVYRQAVRTCKRVLDYLDDGFGTAIADIAEGEHTLRTARYLMKDTSSEDILFPEHRDFSLLTAFIGAGEEGLEVQSEGDWYPVHLEYGDVLIGAGTPMRQFNPSVRALVHRIVGGADQRVSSFLFYELAPDVVLPESNETYGAMLSRVMETIRT